MEIGAGSLGERRVSRQSAVLATICAAANTVEAKTALAACESALNRGIEGCKPFFRKLGGNRVSGHPDCERVQSETSHGHLHALGI
eukprot:scaffold19271_cov28-Tisochrysis_lutea.AAC.7